MAWRKGLLFLDALVAYTIPVDKPFRQNVGLCHSVVRLLTTIGNKLKETLLSTLSNPLCCLRKIQPLLPRLQSMGEAVAG